MRCVSTVVVIQRNNFEIYKAVMSWCSGVITVCCYKVSVFLGVSLPRAEDVRMYSEQPRFLCEERVLTVNKIFFSNKILYFKFAWTLYIINKINI